ncbi:riboflavin synthase domain-like protein [Serendipita vermifera]|nr:riboflavin synthase domain-like protein [Serendipita vermifera]
MSDTEDDRDPRHLLILYATETGNAFDAAERIAREARRRHFHTTLSSVDEYDSQDLIEEDLVIFVLSTTGSGEEPRPLRPLWQQLLRSDLPEDLFDEMNFTVFGLGDSAYERFCWASKKLVRRMISLGATQFAASCHSDEQDRFGYETALIPWMDQVFEKLAELYPLPESLEFLPANQLPSPRAKITVEESGAVKEILPVEPATTYHHATLLSNDRITSPDWYQDVRHLVFQFDEKLEWAPGDVAILHPSTQPEDVQALLDRFDWTSIADSPLTIESISYDQPLPSYLTQHPTTLRTLFTSVLDISCVPRKSFFEFLVHFTSDPLEKEKFEEFTSLTADGQDDLFEYTHRVRRTILEVLQDFRYVSIPLEYIFDVFPPIRARQFSIASSSLYANKNLASKPSSDQEPTQKEEAEPEESDLGVKKAEEGTRMELCIAIVNYRTKLKAPRRGLCTTWLSNLVPPKSENTEASTSASEAVPVRLRIGLRKGALRLPLSTQAIEGSNSSAHPVICVGPGTGIAPMRAIIQERIARGDKDNTLYFGCRSSSNDYYYSTEWESFAQSGGLAFSVAFSRDQDKKVYVQHLIENDAKRIWELVGKQNASVYISGSSNKMPAAVKEAIKLAAQTEGGLSPEEAEKYIGDMEWTGRLFEECWS